MGIFGNIEQSERRTNETPLLDGGTGRRTLSSVCVCSLRGDTLERGPGDRPNDRRGRGMPPVRRGPVGRCVPSRYEPLVSRGRADDSSAVMSERDSLRQVYR